MTHEMISRERMCQEGASQGTTSQETMFQGRMERKTKLDELNLVDRFLFDETMESPEAYEALVSILMENEVHLLAVPETEKELQVSPQLRSIRLDVVGMDEEGCIYYTEMQKTNPHNLARRSRYYQAQVDVSLLEPGVVNFNQLQDTCFILIAPFDIFGRGLYRYTFEGVCRECPDLKLNDGAVRIFINTKGTNREEFSEEFLSLMEYITESTDAVAEKSRSEKLQLIHDRVTQIKQSEKMGVKYMQAWEEKVLIREEGQREGRKEGRVEGIIKACKSLGTSWDTARAMLIDKFELDDKDAEKYRDLYW